MRIFGTIVVIAGLTLALTWLPMPGIWWHVVRWAFYIPILSVGIRYGSFAGLFTGVAASLCVLAAASRGLDDAAWTTILAPDFAFIGFLGGRFLKVWPRFRHLNTARRTGSSPPPGRISEPEINVDLNPLASIESATRLLADDDTTADLRQELAGIIITECGHISATLMDLLRRDRAAAPPQVCDADITAIIDAAVREIEFVLCGRGITLRKEIAPDLPPIECNKDQIRNLFMSLAINAVQSAPGGSVVVLTAHHGDGGVILDVKDQGQGSFVRQVANRFFGSRSRRAGIGLAAAYDIVRQHGGKIEAKADITKGLEFSVWLPLHRNCANGGWQGAGGGGR